MHHQDYFKHRKAFDIKHIMILDTKVADEMNSNAIEDMYQAFKDRLLKEGFLMKKERENETKV